MDFAASSRTTWELCQSPCQCCMLSAEKPSPSGPPICVCWVVGCPQASSGYWLWQSLEQGWIWSSFRDIASVITGPGSWGLEGNCMFFPICRQLFWMFCCAHFAILGIALAWVGLWSCFFLHGWEINGLVLDSSKRHWCVDKDTVCKNCDETKSLGSLRLTIDLLSPESCVPLVTVPQNSHFA